MVFVKLFTQKAAFNGSAKVLKCTSCSVKMLTAMQCSKTVARVGKYAKTVLRQIMLKRMDESTNHDRPRPMITWLTMANLFGKR